MQVLISAFSHQHGPEARLPDAVPLPEFECRGFEPLEQRGQPPDHAMVNPQLIDHGCLFFRVREGTEKMARNLNWLFRLYHK